MSAPIIFIGNKSINLSHVTGTTYVPAGTVAPSTLDLSTVTGNEHVTGTDADAVWSYIQAIGVDVVALAAAKRRKEQEAEDARNMPKGRWR